MDKETKERMEGLIPQAAARAFDDAVDEIANDLLMEGFEIIDVRNFLLARIRTSIYEIARLHE